MKPVNPLRQQVEATFDAIDTAMIIAVEETTTSDTLLASLARAHVAITKTEMIMHAIDVPHDADRVYADEVRKDIPIKRAEFEAAQRGELPPLKKQPQSNAEGQKERPGIAKHLKRALDFVCPTCHAIKGEACFRMTKPGWNGAPTEERKAADASHGKRFALSRAANDKIRAQYDREHFA